jgi:hypothetical protein
MRIALLPNGLPRLTPIRRVFGLLVLGVIVYVTVRVVVVDCNAIG